LHVYYGIYNDFDMKSVKSGQLCSDDD